MLNRPFLLRSLSGLAMGLLLAACNMMDVFEMAGHRGGTGSETGLVRLDLTLSRTPATLGKAAVGDTTFSLDSVIIQLSAAETPSQTHRLAISGRADLGNITVPTLEFELASPRAWKAKIFSIDINGVRRDTVHLDSITFAVRPAQTTWVEKTVSPAYSILKVRILSTNDALIPDSVRYVRLRVDNVTRDSAIVGSAPATATLNWVQAMPTGNIVHAVGNHGRVLRSTNSGDSWTEIRMPEEDNLVSGFATGDNRVYNISNKGLLRWSLNGGVTWEDWHKQQVTTSPDDTLRRMYLSTASRAYAVGRNGSIYGVNNNHTIVRTTSNTTHHLNGVHFPSANVGYVVGENETILRTTNGNVNWMGDVVWLPLSGGWFHQTSAAQGSPVHSINFMSTTKGRAFLNGGALMFTDNGGATWSRITNQGTSEHIYDGQHVSSTVGFLVGARGTFRKTTNAHEQHAYWNGLANNFQLPTSVDLFGLHFVNPDTGLLVGTGGTIYRTRNGTDPISAGSNPRLQVETRPSGTTHTLRSVRFASRMVAVAVGDNGTIVRTINTGNNWSTRPSGTTVRLTGVSFANANVGYISGFSGTILKTTDGGSTWTALASGTSVDLWTVSAISADTVYVGGVGGTLRKSVNGGTTWFSTESPTAQTIRKVSYYNADVGFAVGDSGLVLNAVNQGENWTGGGIKRSLKAVHFVSPSTGWVVGADGIILKTIDSGRVWVEQHRQTGLMLHAVHFQNANTGWATGATGEVFKTTNGGATWEQQATIVTTIPLTWISFRNTTEGFIIGGSDALYATSNGGTTWTPKFAGGMPGSRLFDEMLAWKYLRPGQSHTVVLQAIDRISPLRGYQSTMTITVGAGQDTTITTALTPCGRGGPVCLD